MNEEQHPIVRNPSPSPQPPTPAKVLIRAPNWVGDAVMAVPALRELRRIFANADVTIAGRPWVLGLFEGEGLADHLVPLDSPRSFLGRVSGFIDEARRLRRASFDCAVLLTNSFGTALVARAGGAHRITGYATDARGFLLDQVIPFEPDYKTLHQVRFYLNIAAQVERRFAEKSNVSLESSEPCLLVSDEQRHRARAMLEPFGIGAQDRLLAINPGATNSSAKRWLAERFAATADRLNNDGFHTVIVGAAGDKPIADEVARLMDSDAAVIAGETSIADLKAVLSCASLVVSNDTGTSHVSAALGVPTVVVFGPTEHVSTRPLSDRATVVRHDVECSPCMLRECPIDHRCMTRVQVDDVYLAAQTLLTNAATLA